MSAVVKNVTFVGSLVGNYAFAHPVLSLLKARYPNRVKGGEDLVIEGFARSGNSFFHNALMLWNPGLKTAHHCHLFCNVQKALALNIPCVVLIRDPGQAVASMVVWDGKLDPRLGLLGWMHFYRQLLRVRDKCLILRFDEVINEPEVCISRMNERFGLELLSQPFFEKERRLIYRRLSDLDRNTGKGVFNSSVPNNIKSRRKEKVLSVMQGSSLLQGAERLYHRIVGGLEMDVGK